MANLLDEFFVAVGWDTRAFDKGKAQVEKGFADAKESSRKSANDIEAAGKRAASFFRSMRNETVGFFLALQGASSFKSFLGDLITGAAQTDRLAKNMGVARNELYAWQNLIKTTGGNATDATSALQTLASQIQSYRLGIKTGNEGNLAGLGVTASDLTDPSSVLLKIAGASGKMDRAQYANRLGMLGFSPEMIELLSKGRVEVQRQLDLQKQHAQISDRDALAAEKFQKALAELATTIKGKILPLLTPFIEELTKLLNGFESIDQASPALIAALGLIALATIAAAAPWIAWAAAIATVIAGVAYVMDHSGAKKSADPSLTKPGGAMDQALMGGYSAGDPLTPSKGGAGGGGLAGSTRDFMIANGIDPKIAAGIGAGVFGEGGSLGMSANGAFGIGQWRGDRMKRLFARYGRNPNLRQQQEFLLWELKGGDFGGASVLSSGSTADALKNYVGGYGWGFMRPDTPGNSAGSRGDIRRGMGWLGMRVPAGGGSGGGGGSNVSIGSITVNAPGGDGPTIARSLEQSLKSRGMVFQSAGGMSQ